ncbi:MAG: FAD-dependent oxidoreductase [Armatimonadetes bacterium]|nr:FAD-dependent oxidoreductase [Armatimonadota bacterium]
MSKDALVIGGGIAGIQAAIDLAERGIKVKLVEKQASIGGRMAQLDKTFPTNDCSMCILAPKMIECFDHPNIEVLTHAEVVALEGEAGDFKALIKKKAKFVKDNCTACGDCAKVCPVEVPNAFDMGLSTRKAIYIPFPQAVPKRFVIDKLESPCKNACPLGMDVQGYIALIAKGKLNEAYNLIRMSNPLPSICGRVCMHPCETICRRKHVDQPIAVAALKRFVCDHVSDPTPPKLPDKKGKKVAIIGAGPGGLTAAHDLALLGYRVTVFEALPLAGGMLAVGIPAYRLPKDVLQKEIGFIESLGVEIRTSTRIGRDLSLSDLATQGFEATLIAAGAHKSKKLPIPGADLPGVLLGTAFLRDVALGDPPKLGPRVLVLGGGNVAFDCARTAMRLGALEVRMACVESRSEMPAHPDEIHEGEAEGVVLHPSVSFKRIVGESSVQGVECSEVVSATFDEAGRLTLQEEPDSEHVIAADTVIFAIGQAADLEFIAGASGLSTTQRGFLGVDDCGRTGRVGVFACGDAAGCDQTVVHAMASGRLAAHSIDQYLRGVPVEPLEARLGVGELSLGQIIALKREHEAEQRHKPEEVEPELRRRTFDEVASVFTLEEAQAEANRCLECAICSGCRECVAVCRAGAIDHSMRDEIVEAEVGAVVVANGLDYYNIRALEEYGYGTFPNVLTAMEFERLICASGPTHGHIERPSDGKVPEKIAFIQCVGSRDVHCMPYCTTVCCMHATKEAILANEHEPDLSSTIFYTDLRAMGKGFWDYTRRAEREYRVSYVRSKPGSVTENPVTNDLSLWYEDQDDGKFKSASFGMVVLAQALLPSGSTSELSKVLGLNVDEFGYFSVKDKLRRPVDTNREGIYVCGFCQAPQDIPDSVVQASAAACRAAETLVGGKR